jgi:pre-rRNA-processing protein TSR3
MANRNNNITLYCIHFKECDPKKCSALKLRDLGLLRIIKSIKGSLKKAIVLNPLSNIIISYKDKNIMEKYGLIVLDCSWKNILKFSKYSNIHSRKLPPLIAANPVNYGKWEKLNSAEAVASGLYLTGFERQGKKILSKFRWGKEFWRLNKKLLESRKK